MKTVFSTTFQFNAIKLRKAKYSSSIVLTSNGPFLTKYFCSSTVCRGPGFNMPEKQQEMRGVPYLSIVGSLMYLATWLEISYY